MTHRRGEPPLWVTALELVGIVVLWQLQRPRADHTPAAARFWHAVMVSCQTIASAAGRAAIHAELRYHERII